MVCGAHGDGQSGRPFVLDPRYISLFPHFLNNLLILEYARTLIDGGRTIREHLLVKMHMTNPIWNAVLMVMVSQGGLLSSDFVCGVKIVKCSS